MIVWILEADPDVLQDSLLREAGVPSTMEELTSAFAVTGGQARLKSNYLAHDALADALATSDPCLARANTLLSDMVKILTSGGSGAKYFQRDDAGSTTTSIVWNFHPTRG